MHGKSGHIELLGRTRVRSGQSNDGVEISELFDFVVIGAGTAGCVLANRLSSDPANRVCLIEAGPPDSNPFIHIPLGVMRLIDHPTLNWRFLSVPQPNAGGRKLPMPRGKVIGGSGSINGMVYTRGHPRDYDEWAEVGNPGWSYRDVLPYFRRSENNETWPNSPYHGSGGPLNVTNLDSYNELCEVLFQAAEAVGYERCPDFCAAPHEGFSLRQATIRKGRRESTATAFLHPALKRKNLTVIPNAQVARILLRDRRAIGVEYASGDEQRRVGARREVILAAGVIGSPQILMLSGIGDEAELKRHGIDVAHALSGVGRNLQEHVSTPVRYSSPTTVPYGFSLRTAPWIAWSMVEYLLFRRGLLANNIMHAGGFVRTDPALDRPDVQFILEPGSRSKDGDGGYGHGYGLVTVVLHPKSRGRVTLASSDFRAAPEIDPGFLSAREDVDLAALAVRLARRLLETDAFAPYRGAEMLPGPRVQNDADLESFVRNNASTGFHAAGSCRMGKDPGAVVDAALRVIGIQGLRVADASIMPTLVGGNPASAVIMIAEKASDMILGRKPPAAATLSEPARASPAAVR